MPANPLEKAIRSGIRMNDRIGDLFAKLGTSEHPRGDVLSAYRQARLAMKSALEEPNRIFAVNDVLGTLRMDVQRSVADVFESSISLGGEEARRQLRFYDVTTRGSINLSTETQSALDAVMSRFDAQAQAVRAIALIGEDPSQMILGDEERAGMLTHGELVAGAAYWLTFLAWNSFDAWVGNSGSGLDFQKQAVAALDGRTTDCCLRVHGQVQPFDKPFILTGTPRFADKMDHPGFHYFCRTSITLYLAEFDDGLTSRMRESARYFLNERAAGRRPDRDPADAFA